MNEIDEEIEEIEEAEEYEIVRFYQDSRPKEVIETGLTRKEAQEHCSDPDSSGDGWFDGFQKA